MPSPLPIPQTTLLPMVHLPFLPFHDNPTN